MFRSGSFFCLSLMLALSGCDGDVPASTLQPAGRADDGQTDGSQTDRIQGGASERAVQRQSSELDHTNTRRVFEERVDAPSHQKGGRAPVQIEMTGPGRSAPQAVRKDQGLLPLARVLHIATAAVPGDVIEVELDDGDDDDAPEYELKILTADGRSIEVTIDARRGTILEIDED